MKKVLLLTLGLTLCAGVAMADHIGLYNELTGVNCFRSAAWNPAGSNFVYVIQRFNTGSSGSEFKVNDASNAPFSSTTMGNAAFLLIGEPLAGCSVAYTSCVQTGDVYIMRLRFADDDELGLAPIPCGMMEVVPDPTAQPPVLITNDCGSIPHPATGGRFFWGAGCGQCGDPTATESTSWGGVKALYR